MADFGPIRDISLCARYFGGHRREGWHWCRDKRSRFFSSTTTCHTRTLSRLLSRLPAPSATMTLLHAAERGGGGSSHCPSMVEPAAPLWLVKSHQSGALLRRSIWITQPPPTRSAASPLDSSMLRRSASAANPAKRPPTCICHQMEQHAWSSDGPASSDADSFERRWPAALTAHYSLCFCFLVLARHGKIPYLRLTKFLLDPPPELTATPVSTTGVTDHRHRGSRAAPSK